MSRVYSHLGRLDEAEKLQIEVVDIRKRVFGLQHPTTLHSMRGAALVYHAQGQWTMACELLLQVMHIEKWTSHPEQGKDTLDIVDKIGQLLPL